MDILSKLPERLQELMTERNLNATALAKKIDVNVATITRYLRGERLPSFSYFTKLLEIFNCSADFLMGLTEDTPSHTVFHTIPPFSSRFRTLLEEHNMTQYALHQKTNFSYDNFNKWLKGKTSPYVDNLKKLADAFECSVDHLIGHTL